MPVLFLFSFYLPTVSALSIVAFKFRIFIGCFVVQCGKGRDVGLNQIAAFEGKVASGNGEQTLSRDIYRLGQLFDFFRMMSFFFTTVGYYFTTMVCFICYLFYDEFCEGLSEYILEMLLFSQRIGFSGILFLPCFLSL